MNNNLAPQKQKRSKLIPIIVSFLLAFTLWFYVVGTESPTNVETFKNIPINYITSDSSLAIYSGDIESVDLKVKGKRSTLSSIDKNEFAVTCDVSGYTQEGEYTVDLSFVTPPGTTIESSSAKSLMLYIAKKVTKTVPIELDVTFSSQYDSTLIEKNMVPSVKNIVVTGPESYVSKIVVAKASYSLGELEKSMAVKDVDLVLVDADGNSITTLDNHITIDVSSIDIEVPLYISKTVPISIDVDSSLSNLNITSSINEVEISGSIETIDEITEIKTDAISGNITPGSMSVRLMLPSGVSSTTQNIILSISASN